MARKVHEVDDFDLSIDGSTLLVPINGNGPISIQPVLTSLTGAPTYTVEVSNDGENYTCYDASAEDVAIATPIWIAYDVIPWQYLRFTITSNGATGIVRFKLFIDV
jgi:hypothetical protein